MRFFYYLPFVFLVACSKPDLAPIAAAPETRPQEMTTLWSVRSAEGLDAILLIGAMSGDELQAQEYPEDIAAYRAKLNEKELLALSEIGVAFSRPGSGLAGPRFVFDLAAADDLSFDGVGAILADPLPFLSSIGETPDPRMMAMMKKVDIVYRGLGRAGFSKSWHTDIMPEIESRAALFSSYLNGFDIIPLHERYLGRDIDETIDVILLHFNRPYGIRVRGQRFVTFHGWSEQQTLRIAAHEIFHPPFDKESAELRAAGADLSQSPLIQSIIANANPAFGYSSLESLIDEDSTQALDMVVSDRLALERDPGAYWRHQDDGMHLLAAAIYDAMIETGFAESGGTYEDWFIDALGSEILSPAAVERRARKILGDAAVDKWID